MGKFQVFSHKNTSLINDLREHLLSVGFYVECRYNDKLATQQLTVTKNIQDNLLAVLMYEIENYLIDYK